MILHCENYNIEIDTSECFWLMIEEALQTKKKLVSDEIQNKKGCYIFFDYNNIPIRIGKAVKLRNRIISYYTGIDKTIFEKMQNEINFVSVIYTDKHFELELQLLNFYKPKFNTNDLDTYINV